MQQDSLLFESFINHYATQLAVGQAKENQLSI